MINECKNNLFFLNYNRGCRYFFTWHIYVDEDFDFLFSYLYPSFIRFFSKHCLDNCGGYESRAWMLW